MTTIQLHIGPYTEELISDVLDPTDDVEFTDECFSDPDQIEQIFTELLVNGPNLIEEYRRKCFEMLESGHVDLVEEVAEIYYDHKK